MRSGNQIKSPGGTMEKRPLEYLATPYWHKNPIVRSARAIAADFIYAQFVCERRPVFGPITSCSKVRGLLPGNFESWAVEYDLSILAHCQKLVVALMPGWGTSRGIRAEVEFAVSNQIEIEFFDAKPILEFEPFPWPPNNQQVSLWSACAGPPGTVELIHNVDRYMSDLRESLSRG